MQLDAALLSRLCRDFVCGHAARLRSQSPLENLDMESRFDGAPLFLDSLERVQIAGLFADAWSIRVSGLEDLLLARPTIRDWVEILDSSLRHYDRELCFFTSGSTGTPKACRHQTDWLRQELLVHMAHIDALLHEHFGLARPSRILVQVDSHHIYGFLFSILLPSLYAEKHGIMPQLLRVGPGFADFKTGDLVITVPFIVQQWQHMAAATKSEPAPPAQPRRTPRPARHLSIISSAPLDTAAAQWHLSQRGPYLEVFGSSETAGIATRTSPDAAFSLLPSWQRVGEGQIARSDGTHFDLPDRVAWKDERNFVPQGRKDDAVSIGGINVFPQQLAERLLAAPGVAEVAIRPAKVEGGERLKAFVVPRDLGILSQVAALRSFEQDLRAWVAQHFSSPERPQQWSFGPELPRTAMGKLRDW